MTAGSQRQFRIRTMDGFTREPVTEAELVTLIRRGRLGADDEAQRIGSERWRTLQQLAPNLFTQQASDDNLLADLATEVRAVPRPVARPYGLEEEEKEAAEEDEERWQEEEEEEGEEVEAEEEEEEFAPTRKSAKKAAKKGSARKKAPAPRRREVKVATVRPGSPMANFNVLAWVFVGVAGLEVLRWLNAMLVSNSAAAVLAQATGGMMTPLLPIPPSFVQSMTLPAVLGLLFVVGQPLLVLGTVPGALMTNKLLKAMPEDERPFSEKQNWIRWMLWLIAPLGGIILLRVLSPESLTLPAVIGAASSGVLVLFGLYLVSISQAVRNRVEESGAGTLRPLGMIAGWMLVGAAGARALVYLYLGFMTEGMASGGAGPGDLKLLMELSTYAQIGAVGVTVAWAVELALILPKIADEVFPEE